MSLAMHHVVIDCETPSLLAEFWAKVLGYEKEEWGDENGAVTFNPDDRRTRLLFLPVPEPKQVKNRIHIDVETDDNSMEAEVRRLEGLGATRVERKEYVADTWRAEWTIMFDPEGNEFCVSRKPATSQPR